MQARDLAMARDLALTGKVALMEKAGTMGKALMALELMGRGLAKRVVLAKAFDQAGRRAASCLMQLAPVIFFKLISNLPSGFAGPY